MSSLIHCPGCQKDIVYCVSNCPYCGCKVSVSAFAMLSPETKKDLKIKKSGLYALLISVVLGLGCCGYYSANQPTTVDWDLQGRPSEWKGTQPYETEKIASKGWFAAGMLLILFSPIVAVITVIVLTLIDTAKKSNISKN